MKKPEWMPLSASELSERMGMDGSRLRRAIIPKMVESEAYQASQTGEWWIEKSTAEQWVKYAEERRRRIESEEYPTWHSKRAWSLEDLEECTK
jgi:heat shock protein HslJ